MLMLPALTTGCEFNLSREQAERHRDSCSICMQARMRRTAETKKAPRYEKSNAPGELVYSDLLGPLPASVDGNYRYLAVFVDDFSRYTMCYPMRDKGDLELQYARYEQDMSEYFISQRRRLHTDNGGEFESKALAEYLLSNDIKHTTSCPYSPNQNAIAEQAMWRLCSVARALLLDSGFPVCHWVMAVTQAALRLNLTPRRMLRVGSTKPPPEQEHSADDSEGDDAPPIAPEDKEVSVLTTRIERSHPTPAMFVWTTPYQRLKGRKPNVRFLRVFEGQSVCAR